MTIQPTADSAAQLGEVAPGTWQALVPVPDPEQPLREGLTEEDVSPGVPAFLAIFAVAVATILLVRSLTSKLRGVNHRAAELEAEEAAAAEHDAGPDAEPGPGPGPDPSDEDGRST